MSKSIGPPQQHKQPSRKGKKAWRKNVDITEVQTGLEALREDILQGGPISEKKSEDLFALDVVGSEDIKKTFKLQKPLKVDEILAKRSLVPGVDSRKRSGSRVTDGILEPSSKRQKKDWVSKKEVQRLRQVANATSHLENHGDDEPQLDLWAMEPVAIQKTAREIDYIPQTRPKVAPSSLSQAPIPMTASGKPVRAVKNPDAGISYNPSFDEWDDLLNREGAKELTAEQARIQKMELEEERQRRIEAASRDEANRAEDDSGWEGFETEPEESELLKKKRPQRKTPAQRNKLKRRKEAERIAKHEKRTSDKQRQAMEIALATSKTTKKPDGTVSNASDETNENEVDADDTKLRRRRIGNAPIPEKRLELVLPDELQESLRQLKPEGNLLQDRFRNLLVNGKIESRKPVLAPKQRKVKVTEKWSHKDFSVTV